MDLCHIVSGLVRYNIMFYYVFNFKKWLGYCDVYKMKTRK
jgi:hypothetical protein